MQKSFWNNTERPLLISAPMSNVTDAAMRLMMARYGKPDIIFTEFVSTAGLCSPGYERLVADLRFSEEEHPIVAQLFGKKPEQFFRCAEMVQQLGFDGIDINLGCPDKLVLRQGAGSALIGQETLVAEIVQAAKEGSGLPVSVKTRLGHTEDISESWIESLAAMEPAAIILHGRTVRQMYHGLADWESIGRAAAVARRHGVPFIGNGDITSREEALGKAAQHSLDGIMVGRALMGNPWFFHPEMQKNTLPPQKVFEAMIEHAALQEHFYPGRFHAVRKHIKSYVHEFPRARALRHALVQTDSVDEIRNIVRAYCSADNQEEDKNTEAGQKPPSV